MVADAQEQNKINFELEVPTSDDILDDHMVEKHVESCDLPLLPRFTCSTKGKSFEVKFELVFQADYEFTNCCMSGSK